MNKNKFISILVMIMIAAIMCIGCKAKDNTEADKIVDQGVIEDKEGNKFYLIKVYGKDDFASKFEIDDLTQEQGVAMADYTLGNNGKQSFYYVCEYKGGIVVYNTDRDVCLFTKKKMEIQDSVSKAAFTIGKTEPMNYEEFEEKIK